MFRVRVKICGLTRVEDVRVAVQSGADAVGFVFTTSPRRVSADTARDLSRYVPDGVLRVGLFLDQDRAEVEAVIDSVPLDVLQFHGAETRRQCNRYGLPYLKAVAMQDGGSLCGAVHEYPDAMGLLLDSHTAGQPGGSGKVFNWRRAEAVAKPVWLAGGLNRHNVSRAIKTVNPFAVDVSSGVEASPGIKDADKVRAFLEAVRKTEIELESEGR